MEGILGNLPICEDPSPDLQRQRWIGEALKGITPSVRKPTIKSSHQSPGLSEGQRKILPTIKERGENMSENTSAPLKEGGNKSIYDILADDIMASEELSLGEKNERLSRLVQARSKKVNILLVGATGCGKSSTVNALFDMDVAKVGVGVDPETESVDRYELENLIIWDTPGLGDSKKEDDKYNRFITEKLAELDENGEPLIDLVLMILDSSSKDLGTSYKVLNDIVIPCLGENETERILIGLNQADVAMKGRHWDIANNIPDDTLLKHLKSKAASVKRRIKDETGVEINPVFYCAGYKEEGEDQCKPYNLTKLLYMIVKMIPKEKRIALADNINKDPDNWIFDDGEEDYKAETTMSMWDSIRYTATIESYSAGETGERILGVPGKAIGIVLGGTWGAVKGFFEYVFG